MLASNCMEFIKIVQLYRVEYIVLSRLELN